MGLTLFRDPHDFARALEASSGHVYSICNRDRLDARELIDLERRAAGHGHRELLTLAALRDDALSAIEQFFADAARLDRGWRFAYSSKVVLSVPDYQDLQKIFLLRAHFARDRDAEVRLFVPDRRLRELFADLFASARTSHGLALPARRARLNHSLALPARRAWARFARTLLRAIVNRPARVRAQVLVFTLSSGVPRAGTDAYFGTLAKLMSAKAPTLTVYLASGPAVRLPRDAGREPFESFVSALDVIGAWCAAWLTGAFAHKRGLGPTGDGLAPLHRYVRSAEVRSGEYFMQRLLERGFGRTLARMRPEVLVYPFENRSWEKHLLAAAHARGVRCIAYQHSSITPRHLALHVAAGEIAAEHLPDRVVTVGAYATSLLADLAPALSGRLETGVSLRSSREALPDSPEPGVLVAISSSASEALRLLQVTHEAAARVQSRFIVRSHPTIPIAAMFALFPWPPNVELSAGTTLAQDLARVTCVAYSSSTVALEGMLSGRLPIYVDIGDVPDGDPMSGEHPFKLAARDGAGLADAVLRVSTLDAAELRRLRHAAGDFAERYLAAPTAEAVDRMAATLLAA